MSDKYKMFRNFMVNELGISKDELMKWTKESVAEEVKKLFGQMNVDELIKKAALGSLNNVSKDEVLRGFQRSFSSMLVAKFDLCVMDKESRQVVTAHGDELGRTRSSESLWKKGTGDTV